MCPLARCQTRANPPVASIAGPPHAHVAFPFTLTAGGSSDDGGIAAHHWDLNANGTFEVATGVAPTTSATLTNEGFPADAAVVHPLRVSVTDIDGVIARAQVDIPVFPPIQIAGGVSNAKPKIGQQVTFDARGSSDPAGDPVTFAWDFDGNGSTDSTSALATHAYKAPGAYTAALTVADPHGALAQATVQVTVPEPTGPASVKKLRLKPTAFSAEPKGPSVLEPAAVKGTTVTVTMSKSATVKFSVQRRARVRGKTVYRNVKGGFSRKLKFGANTFRFTGRIGSKSLATGNYRLVALPTTKRSRATRTAFRIVK
jgi:PKD repeat protein